MFNLKQSFMFQTFLFTRYNVNYLACNRSETFRGFRGMHARTERESARAESLSILNPGPYENKNRQELTSTKNFVDSGRSALAKTDLFKIFCQFAVHFRFRLASSCRYF